MSLRRSLNLLSAALVAGLLFGLVPALVRIVSQHYIKFKAYRLIALGLSSSLTRALSWGAAIVLVFIAAWLLLRLAAGFVPDRATRISAALTLLAVAFWGLTLAHSRLAQGDSPYARRIDYLKHGFNRLLTGDVALGRVLELNSAKLVIIAAVLIAAAGVAVLAILAVRGIAGVPWGLALERIDRWGSRLRVQAALAVLFAAALGLAARPPSGMVADSRRPHVVWIVIDALRADHLGCYGYGKPTSPFLDGLAAEGVLFRRAFSQESYTHASVPSFFTSTYAFQHRSLYDQPRIDRLDPRFLTVAEALKNAGYRTEAYVFNPHLDAKYRLDQGFDLYADHRKGGNPGDPIYRQSETAARIHDAVGRSLAAPSTRPRFLYLHYRDVHVPYAPPPPFHKAFLPEGVEPRPDILYAKPVPEDRAHLDLWVSQYDGEILYTDTVLERTFALLRKRGLRRDNTIVIITADHGEEFLDIHPGDEGGIGHGRTLYNELLRVPLILLLPRVAGGGSIDVPVELNDVFPTLVDILGLKVAAEAQFQGRSLMPLIRGEAVPGRPVVSGGRRGRGAIIEDGWKLIRRRPDEKAGREAPFREELYDLRTDPGETVDLAVRESARAASLRKRLLEIQVRPAMVGRVRPVLLDQATEERLRSLGYLK